MRKVFAVSLALALAAGCADEASDPSTSALRGNEDFSPPAARVYRSERGRPLTVRSVKPAAAVAVGFLRARGMSAADADKLRVVAETRSQRGVTHLRIEQEIDGLRVAGAYAKAAVSDDGELLSVIDTLVAGSRVSPAQIDEERALGLALAKVHPGVATPAADRRDGNVLAFARGQFFHDAPTVERVIIPHGSSLRAGFLVETWSSEKNQLDHILVSGDGRVLDVENRTATDSYAVFPVAPGQSPQEVRQGPGAGNAESPAGWLAAGAHRDIHISGNNVSAYLDAVADGAPDTGGTAVSSGNFLTSHSAGEAPSTAGNRAVAVQNLFYLNNLIHDVLYRHGFDEAAGNFQNDNFGKGGRGADAVNAEAQDGGGTDNANFATPRDGRHPRMQMYLWNGNPTHLATTSAGEFPAAGADFGPPLDATGVAGNIVAIADGTAPTDDGCEAFTTQGSAGSLALVSRGTCAFAIKVKNAQLAGFGGVIVHNNTGGDTIGGMGGEDATITIPSVMVSQNAGATLRAATSPTGSIHLKDPPPLMVDGDLDSDIVYHEYGHGLTWRMIGRMNGPIAGAIGEGMSDVLSVILNGDPVVGEYSFSDPRGIRRHSYLDYPLTYKDMVSGEVHNDGEAYAAIGWRLYEIFAREGLGPDVLLGYLIDGMNYTPAGPKYEDMRDGILQSVAASGSGHECLIWEAFAEYGVGVGAKATVKGSTVTVVESFTRPAMCL